MPPSAFISTSKSPAVAEKFCSKHVYILDVTDGIDVNKNLGGASPYPDELEVVVENGIPVSKIKGVTLPEEGYSVVAH